MAGGLDQVDEFGLPLRPPTLLGDTPEAAAARQATAADAMRQLLAAAERNLGAAEARRLWALTAKRRPGRPSKPAMPEADAWLLRLFDMGAGSGHAPKKLPRLIAARCSADYPGEFGLGAGAIEARLRKLLRDRAKAERDRIKRNVLLFGAAEPPLTFLSGDLQAGPGGRLLGTSRSGAR